MEKPSPIAANRLFATVFIFSSQYRVCTGPMLQGYAKRKRIARVKMGQQVGGKASIERMRAMLRDFDLPDSLASFGFRRASDQRKKPAVNAHDFSGYERSLVGKQECDHIRDFVRAGGAPERMD